MKKTKKTILIFIASLLINQANTLAQEGNINRYLKIEISESEYEILNLNAEVQYSVRTETNENNTLVIRIYDDSDNLLSEYPANAIIYPLYDYLDMPDIPAVEGKIVIVLNCVNEADVCNDLVFAGSYNDYNITVSELAKFTPIPNYEGWYRTEIMPKENATSTRGKPNQLASDGTFPTDWKHQWFAQMKDGNIVNQCEIIRGVADLEEEYNGEQALVIFEDADVVYIRAYAWRKNPCVPAETHSITFNVTVPYGLDDTDIVYIVGEMNWWDPTATPMTKSGNNWTITLHEIEYDTEYKYVANGSWNFEELGVIEEGADCANQVANRKVNDLTMDDTVENFRGITADKCPFFKKNKN